MATFNHHRCNECKKDLLVSDFYVDGKGRLFAKCIPCWVAKTERNRQKMTHEQKEARKKRSRESQRDLLARRKKAVLSAYGGKCSRCGIDDVDVLNLDHINNDGNKHRAKLTAGTNASSSATMYRWVVKNDFPPMFSVLCFNCNVKKHLELVRENYL